MKEGFRQCMAWLHTWTGLVVGWILFFVFLTGSVGYFKNEITQWMQPERPLAHLDTQTHSTFDSKTTIQYSQNFLQQHARDAEEWVISLPTDRTQIELRWKEPPEHLQKDDHNRKHGMRYEYLELQTGHVISSSAQRPEQKLALRKTSGGSGLYRLHYNLHYVKNDTGILIVGICSFLMLLAIISGVITHKKILTDFFTFRPNKAQRSWLDIHNVISVTALPFFIMITYSGLIFFMDYYSPASMYYVYGKDTFKGEYSTPLNPRTNRAFDPLQQGQETKASNIHQDLIKINSLVSVVDAQWGKNQIDSIQVKFPNDQSATIQFQSVKQHLLDQPTLLFSGVTGEQLAVEPTRSSARKVQDVFISLHEANWADYFVRWLYFISGLLGCAMIATGLILWTVKRRREQDKRLKQGQSIAFGFRVVESLNVGTVIGLPIAMTAYFYANRLLPVNFEHRAAWEFHCLFIVWGIMLLHAAIRLNFSKSLSVWKEQCYVAVVAFACLPVLNFVTTDKHIFNTIPQAEWSWAGFDLTLWLFALLFAYAIYRINLKMQQPTTTKGLHKNKKEQDNPNAS